MPSRRTFLRAAVRAAPALGAAVAGGRVLGGALALAEDRTGELLRTAPVARFWTSTGGGGIRCQLCARGCATTPGRRGACRARLNDGGTLKALTYGRPLALQLDPVEKKPFHHVLPGATALSLGAAGCPLRCRFCQNWQLSQSSPEDHDAPFVPPARMAAMAVERDAPLIAFTYNEPSTFVEYALDVAEEGTKRGRRSLLVSCGFMTEAPLDALCDALAAIKIDLKGFSEDFYRTVCGASLAPVLRSIKQISRRGRHLELVNLVVPTLNDSEPMLKALVEWVLGELGPDVPLHFTRFHPDFQLLNLAPTPVEALERARDLALARGLHYVYVGNVPGHPGNHTYCPKCGKVVVRRTGMFTTEVALEGGRCRYCHHALAGVWS